MSARRSRSSSPKPRRRRRTPPRRSRSNTRNCRGWPQIPDALAPGAPVVWDEVPDNVLVDTAFGDAAATEAAFAAADHVVEMEFHVGRVTGVPMEPRAALGHWDAATGRYTLWAGSGGAVRQKAELADGARRRARAGAGGVVRCRRQFRHPQPALCRIGAGAVGVAPARPPGQIHLDPLARCS